MKTQPQAAPTRPLVLLAGALMLVAACTGGASPVPSTAPSSAPSLSAEPSTAPSTEPLAEASSEPEAEAYEVTIATDPTVGQFLTGEGGKTLYIFTKDTGGKSVCNGECATNWPPFVVENGETVTGGDGVTGTFATITRDDGALQVTYGGAPLYYYAGDAAGGETNGQGIGGVWFVATPTGSSSSS